MNKLVVKSLFMRNGDVRIVNSYDVSENSGLPYQYWCLPNGMKFKSEMDVEVDSFESINVYDPDIVFSFTNKILFNLAEEIKKLKIEDGKVINSILHSFVITDYAVNSSIIECIIKIIHNISVYICVQFDENDEEEYFIQLRD